MSRNSLGDLLRQADKAAGLPPVARRGLAGRVRRRAARSRQRVLTPSGIAALLMVAVGVSILLRLDAARVDTRSAASGQAAIPSAAHLAALEDEIGALSRAGDARLSVAHRLAALRDRDQRRARSRTAAELPDPVRVAADERDRAAFTLLRQGDALCRDLGLSQPAEQSYREVVRLFPGSRWASVARQRLAAMDCAPGERS